MNIAIIDALIIFCFFLTDSVQLQSFPNFIVEYWLLVILKDTIFDSIRKNWYVIWIFAMLHVRCFISVKALTNIY